MVDTLTVEEDRALKQHVLDDSISGKYNWGAVVSGQSLAEPMTLCAGELETPFAAEDVAEIVGSALTTLHLSRSEEEQIYTETNRKIVAEVTQRVLNMLHVMVAPRSEKRISWLELHLAVEQALVQRRSYDVARSLLTHRAASHDKPVETLDVKLRRRNGQLVPWSTSKIEIAVRKAFLAQHRDSAPAVEISQTVAKHVAALDTDEVRIEDVQDLVQEAMLRSGHLEIAEAYIRYRAKRAEQRSEESDTGTQQQQLVRVVKPDGSSYLWDGADLRARIAFSISGLDLCYSEVQIEAELRRSVFDDLTEADLQMTVLLNAKALIEKDADFAMFAGRMLLTYLYEEVLDWDVLQDGPGALKAAHKQYFREGIERAIHIDRLSPRLLDYDFDRLAEALDPAADMQFEYLGIQTLYDRYLIIDKSAETVHRLETPQLFWMRVAMGIFLNEPEAREDWVIRLYQLYKDRRFCSSTPTLFNAGTLRSQLSSCYLYKVDDSIESIMMRGIAENAFLSKWAGGLGGSWTSVRGTGGYIKGTNGESQGVIPFLKLHNDQLIAVNQGGKRRGSGCAYLETWHNDILDFLMLRRNTGDERRRTHDMNTANWIPDLFMKRMEARENWTLFRANETPDLHECYGKAFEERYRYYEEKVQRGEIYGEQMPAIELWKQMLKMLFETGHPWITFKDPCNVRSPQDHVGVIHSSNLCTEITLNTSEQETAVCNLGSVVLDQHLDAQGQLDHDRLKETIHIAVRALDNVIDINFYPTDAARTSNMRHRPIGLGVMGLAKALYQRNEPFASEEALAFNDEFMEAIAFYAYQASSDLAQERGVYESYEGSKWSRGLMPQDTIELLEKERGVEIDVPRGGLLDWEPLREKILKQGMRNSNVLAIAPTATISNIMASTPCIEPMYKNIFVKSNLSGDFIVLNTALVRDLKARNLWDADMVDNLKYFDGELENIERVPEEVRRKYKTAFGVDYHYIIQAAARRQKWIDQSQSVNLFLGSADLKTLSHMYRAAWHSGLKTTYYLRTLGASNIEKATVSLKRSKDDAPAENDQESVRVAACRLDAMLNGEECEACQ